MDEKVPDAPAKKQHNGGREDGSRFIAINDFHYHGNDLTELRKLAEVSPALAEKVVDQRDKEERRTHVSYRFGLVSTIVLLGLVLAAFSFILIYSGILSTLIVIGFIFAIALLIRVILTGQWSDTTWFGKLVNFLAKALGSQAPNGKDPGAD